MKVISNLSNIFLTNKDTEIFGYRLDSDPEDREYFVNCPNCSALLLDNGIGNSINCLKCGIESEIETEDWKIAQQTHNMHNQSSRKYQRHTNSHYDSRSIIDLASIVLIVNKDTLLGNFYDKEYDKINYEIIMKKILLPYFKIKSRVIEKNTFIHIGEMEFKVIGMNPERQGVVTAKTYIRCNKFYSSNRLIKRALLITKQKYDNFHEEAMIAEIMSSPQEQLLINKDEISKIKDYEFYVRNCEPESGLITKNSAISIENKEIFSIAKIKLGVIKNNVPYFQRTADKKIYEDYITQEYFKPFFLSGIRKYIELGDSIKIEDSEFFVLNSIPEHGYISIETIVRFKFGISKTKCLEKINKADNRLALNLMGYDINNNHNHIHSSNPQHLYQMNNISLRQVFTGTGSHRINLEELELKKITEEVLLQQKIGEAIRTLPIFKIDADYLLKIEKNKEETMKKCVVCMDEFTLGEELKTLPCCKNIICHYFIFV